LDTILLEFHRLATWDIHRRAVLALVGFKADVAFPLALEMALLGGDAFLATVEAVAAEVLVALLNKAKPSLIPDQSVSFVPDSTV
jgi:hypothetical protein